MVKENKFNFTVDPFELALESVRFGVGSLFAKNQAERSSKKNLYRMEKELGEGMIGLRSELGSRASARGLGPGHYESYLGATEQIGRKQIDFSKYEAELENTGFFTNMWRSLSGGRNRSKIAKDLGKTRLDIQKLMR